MAPCYPSRPRHGPRAAYEPSRPPARNPAACATPRARELARTRPQNLLALTSPVAPARFGRMLLSVQQAARRLGVSPVTIRRWTATGFLPCTRTAGGHRRIDEHDIDDLAKAIGGSNHLAAQLAREREVDVLINTATALAVKLDLTELLLEIAMRMTSLLDCHFCAISEYDVGERRRPRAGGVRPRRPASAGRQPLPPARLPAHATRAERAGHRGGQRRRPARRPGGGRGAAPGGRPQPAHGAAGGAGPQSRPARSRGPEAVARVLAAGAAPRRAPSPARRPWPSRTPSCSPSGGAATRTSPTCARRSSTLTAARPQAR